METFVIMECEIYPTNSDDVYVSEERISLGTEKEFDTRILGDIPSECNSS
jgi:hypothetical protein